MVPSYRSVGAATRLLSMKLRPHAIALQGKKVFLRPMTEEDWAVLAHWNSDPMVLYFAEGVDVRPYTFEEVQEIYRSTSMKAFCFIAEVDKQPIGEAWLQEMNLPYLLEQYQGKDCRRIDLMIGEKAFWGRGLGSEIIELLTAFALLTEKADMVFGCGIADYNPRSLRAFEKSGYQVVGKIKEPGGNKARYSYDLMLIREQYLFLRNEREATVS